jgi:hypothetical protein
MHHSYSIESLTILRLVLTLEIRNAKQSPYLFRSYPYRNEYASDFNITPNPELHDVKIWQVARATSAAPSYFPSLRIDEAKDSQFVDGTHWHADPALELYYEITSQHEGKDSAFELLLSIGTGDKRGHATHKISSIRTIAETIRAHANSEKFEYFRFDGPTDIPPLRFDRWTKDGSGDKTQTYIENAASRYCSLPAVRIELEKCAGELVKLRQARAKTERWERFAMGIYYTCDMCEEEDKALQEARRAFVAMEPEARQSATANVGAHRIYRHRHVKSDVPVLTAQSQGTMSPTEDLSLHRIHSEGSQVQPRNAPSRSKIERSARRRDREYNSSKEYVSHLVTEHAWPWPDPLWEDAVNKKMLSAAHTKFR